MDQCGRRPDLRHRASLRSLGRGAAIVVLGSALIGARPWAPFAGPQSDQAVKAVHLVNLTRYVEWPDEAFASERAPLVIGVLGRRFGRSLERAAKGRTTDGRRLEVRTLDNLSGAAECHLLFVPAAEWRARPDLIAMVERPGLVTVGEGEEFARAGGVISFVAVDGTIRFAVNLAARDLADVRISSRMLALATRIYDRRPETR